MTPPITSIAGGAGPTETAAILAAVVSVLQDEATAEASPPPPPRQSTWVLAWRPRDVAIDRPSHFPGIVSGSASESATPQL